MLRNRTHENGKKSYIDQVQDAGNIDYVKNGEIIKGAAQKSILITDQTDLTNLSDYEPGTIAYTAGFKSMWQMSASGQWVSF